jgi:hypothetical protein
MKAELTLSIWLSLNQAKEHLEFALASTRATTEDTMPNGRDTIQKAITDALRALGTARQATNESLTTLLTREANE